ncbi:MAG: hypothetical protein JWQ24_378 [Tardiphaga sp.]|nr:hypothetical protein [Tardiphaga sp.]
MGLPHEHSAVDEYCGCVDSGGAGVVFSAR